MADGRREWLALGRAMLPARVLGPLLERCGSARALLDAPPGQLGLKEADLARLRQGVEQAAADEEALAKCGAALLARTDDGYPPLLREIHDPPVVLYVRGALPAGPAVAIVGSRRSTPYGRMVAHSLGQGLAAAGVTVVSGLARGIDAAAHEGALAAGGPTVAVLGCGIDRCYPHDHAPLADRIAAGLGAVISEFPPGLAPAGWHFPLRNRIISGLSLGVVVVEAPAKSGALITANLALEQGREVFAVPGSVNSEQARGSHQLLKEGARLVESVEDILDELNLVPPVGQELASCPPRALTRPQPAPASPASTTPPQPALQPAKANDPLLNHLSLDPIGLEDLQAATGMPAGELSAKLLLLELQGVVGRLPGNRLIRLK